MALKHFTWANPGFKLQSPPTPPQKSIAHGSLQQGDVISSVVNDFRSQTAEVLFCQLQLHANSCSARTSDPCLLILNADLYSDTLNAQPTKHVFLLEVLVAV